MCRLFSFACRNPDWSHAIQEWGMALGSSQSPIHLRESEITLPELLKKKGYATCHVGKWHLNGYFNHAKHPQPDDHGFDHWMATQNNAHPNHKNPTNFVLNGKDMGRLNGYSAPLVVEEGIRWLKDIKEPGKPFFLNVWTHEPHLPIESSPEFMKPYLHLKDEGLRQHHGNITQIDYAFGKLMDALDKMDLAGDTFVFFTSDNGPRAVVTKEEPEVQLVGYGNVNDLLTRVVFAFQELLVGRAGFRSEKIRLRLSVLIYFLLSLESSIFHYPRIVQ